MDYVTNTLAEFWSILGEMAPYLLFGFFVAGMLSVFVSAQLVERHLGGKGVWPVVKASFWGVPLPLCSCAVIPVAASLRKHGSSKGATTAFLISTPQTGVDSIFVTLSLLGPVFAIFRPLAAFITGIIGGVLVDAVGQNGAHVEEVKEECHDECCEPGEINRFVRGLKHGFVTLPKDIARDLLVGLFFAGLITALVPDDLFSGVITSGFVSMLIMMAIGIPIYVCATASVPIAAALMLKGVSPGAAFVFLMTGPATNVAAIAIFKNLLGPKALGVYLGTVAISALVLGGLLNLFFRVTHIPTLTEVGWMLPVPLKIAGAAGLLAVIGYALIPKRTKHESVDSGGSCSCERD